MKIFRTVWSWTKSRRDRPQKVVGCHVNLCNWLRLLVVHDLNGGEISKDLIWRTEGSETILIIYDLEMITEIIKQT